jgi:beta-glucuronidase
MFRKDGYTSTGVHFEGHCSPVPVRDPLAHADDFKTFNEPCSTADSRSDMLKPIDNATREVKSLNGLWRFLPDGPGVNQPWTGPLPGKLECPVPSSYNDLFVPSLRDHVGTVWYQRMVTIPSRWEDQRVFLRFDAATHEGSVYVNDRLVTRHVGGYTPFEADLTPLVSPGDEVRLTVGVSNILSNETIPPGRLVTDDLGKTQLRYWHDFFNYSGLARAVYLCSSPMTRVDDISVVTDIAGSTGSVRYDIATVGPAGKAVIDLIDEAGMTVGSSETLPAGTINVPDATLWQPGAAYLYTFRVRLYHTSRLVDEYSLRIGIRTITISGMQILINDRPFYFTGFGKHEDTPVKGKGHDDAWMVHDFELMKWTGANSFRTSHYPYAEEVLDYADRHGVVVIDETPAVGLNLNIGGGIFGSGKNVTFGPDFANDRTRQNHENAIRELVNRDKNHPSVVMWCITNEPDSGEAGARAYFEPLVHLTRQLDTTRPVTYTNLQMVPPEQERIADLFDVIGLNRYRGWYEETGDLATAEIRLEKELQRWQTIFGKPLLMLEYGADTVTGLRSIHQLPWSEDFQSSFYEMYHKVFDRIEAIQGEQVWNFADFGTGPGIFRVDGNRKGVFSRDRRPKTAAYTLRSRWIQKGNNKNA